MHTDVPAILVVADSMRPGGTERQIVALLKGLQRNGRFRTFLVTLKHGGELEHAAARFAAGVLDVGRDGPFDVKPVVRLVQHLGREHIGLVHVFGVMSGLFGLLAARWRRLPIVNGSVRAAPPRLGALDRLSRRCARMSDWIVANSHAGLEAYGLAGQARASVIYSGVDLERFEEVRPQAGAGAAICMVANFSGYKDHGTVVSAFPSIRRAYPEARLVLVGRDAGTLRDTRRLVDRLQLGAAVTFVTDTLRPEVFVARSRVCVLASDPRTHGEGSSNALLEYMALAKPVVATDTGGNGEIIRSGANGLLVPARSPERLAQCVIELLTDPARAAALGQAAEQQVRNEFSLARMVAEYELLYARLLSGPVRRSAQRRPLPA